MKRGKLITLIFGVGALFVTLAVAQEEAEQEYDYIGAKRCGLKPCHGVGNDSTYESWQETVHATAWDNLTEEQKAQEIFLQYYTTGTTAKGVLLEGVQCEACHGPGSGYQKLSVMKDREKSIAAGMWLPDSTTCISCHNADAPGRLGETAAEFDYEKMFDAGVHIIPSRASE